MLSALANPFTTDAPYVEHPVLALVLAQHLGALQDYIQSDERQRPQELHEHSEFRSVSLTLFRATVQGRLKTTAPTFRSQATRNQTASRFESSKDVNATQTEDLSYHRISEYESDRREPNVMLLLH